jgi:hypothetical protein
MLGVRLCIHFCEGRMKNSKGRLAGMKTRSKRGGKKNDTRGAGATGRGARTVRPGNRKSTERGRKSRRFV